MGPHAPQHSAAGAVRQVLRLLAGVHCCTVLQCRHRREEACGVAEPRRAPLTFAHLPGGIRPDLGECRSNSVQEQRSLACRSGCILTVRALAFSWSAGIDIELWQTTEYTFRCAVSQKVASVWMQLRCESACALPFKRRTAAHADDYVLWMRWRCTSASMQTARDLSRT